MKVQGDELQEISMLRIKLTRTKKAGAADKCFKRTALVHASKTKSRDFEEEERWKRKTELGSS